MTLDARRTSHPIQQPVADESEAMTAFDAITYNKGQAFIRMLENYLGEDAFRDGIRRYMAAHAYSNATTADLWQALERATGKPVAAIAAVLHRAGGCAAGDRRDRRATAMRSSLTLRQDRFAIMPAQRQRNAAAAALAGAGRNRRPRAAQPSKILLLDGSAEIPAGACGEAVKVNFGDIGYYRVEYGPNARLALVKQLAKWRRKTASTSSPTAGR